MRSELYAKIRSTTSASQVLTLITVIQRGNLDLAQLGTGDEISDTDLYEETLDVLQRFSASLISNTSISLLALAAPTSAIGHP